MITKEAMYEYFTKEVRASARNLLSIAARELTRMAQKSYR